MPPREALFLLLLLFGCSSSSTGAGGTPSTCGNGVVEGDEMCDLGEFNADEGTCKTDCTDAACGDGFLGPMEDCDDGNLIDGDGCDANCIDTDFCGNGLPDPGEPCDDGNAVETDACRSGCIAAVCGDGVRRTDIMNPVFLGYEECDLGTLNSDFAPDACRTSCLAADCGDGVTDSGEDCDNGVANSDTSPNACRVLCVAAGCGDGVTDDGEACDDAGANSDTQPNACRTACADPSCGDSVTDDGEDCDDGTDSNSCDADCTPAVCGDGYTNAARNEDCDDMVETANCDPDCTTRECGDGFTNLTAGEECDIQDTIANGVCSVGCVVACTGFWENCDGLPSTGCEVDLQTDGDHCGACNFDCGGGACTSGVCQPIKIADLDTLPVFTALIAEPAGGLLYFTTSTGIHTLPIATDTLTAPTPLWTGNTFSRSLLVHGGRVYFTGLAVPETGLSGLHSVDTSGGSVVRESADLPQAFGADSVHLYYVRATMPADIVRMRLSDSFLETVGALPSQSLPGADLVVGATVVYAVDAANAPLWRMNKDPMSPQPVPVVTPQEGYDALADATHLYWAEPSNNAVARIDRDPFGCLPAPVCAVEPFATSVGRPWALAEDPVHVYWLALSDPAVMPTPPPAIERLAKGAGVEETVVPALAMTPRSIAIEGDFLFWIEADNATPGELWKIRKPAP